VFSIIDKGMSVDGSVVGKGNLVVKGLVKGTLTGDSVVIGEDGQVMADTKVRTMTVGGRFEGRVETSGQLVILASGRCTGEIVCGNLSVEAGGRLDARVSCKGAVQGKK
jgi:cytoskeletal protein CcmA (bactofilin family)